MITGPEDPDPLLAEALKLTDTLEAGAADAPGAAPDHEGLRLLVGIGLAFRRETSGAAGTEALFKWGTLEVRRRIGEGRFGEVYAAWDSRLHREVALKLRRPEAGTLRWLDEARSLARVRHPNVVTIHGADLLGGRAGLWMELIDGESLEDLLLANGPFDVDDALRIGRDLASALDAVHRAGVVHGDLKAGNVTLERATDAAPAPSGARTTEPGATPKRAPRIAARRVVLMDFGAASASSPAGTSVGARFATPLYAAPELLEGAAASVSSDVYALGVLLHRMLTGAHPYEASRVEELRAAHVRGDRVPLARRRRGLAPRLVRVVERALSPRPEERQASAALLRDDLARLLGERIPSARPRIVALVALAAAALVSAGLAVRHEIAMRDTEHYVVPPPPTLPMSRQPWWTSGGDSVYASRAFTLALADVNDDGRPDVVISDVTSSSSGYGARVLVYPCVAGQVVRDAARILVADPAGQSGCTVAAGDVNGDGRPDLLVAWENGNQPGGGVGGAELFLGGPRGIAGRAAWHCSGESTYTAFGECIAVVGDVNGDGYNDALIGEHDWTFDHRNQGRAVLYLGGPRGLGARPAQMLTDSTQSERFGHLVCGVGDVNHDGYADVMVGAPLFKNGRGDVGCLQLFFGGPHGLTPAPEGRIEGDQPGCDLGNMGTVVGVGDVNGDGYADVVVSEPAWNGEGASVGRVSLYLGGPRGLRPKPAWHVDGFGSGAMLGLGLAVGDVNGDGLPDLVVGARGFGTSAKTKAAGAVFVFLGAGPKKYFETRPAWWTWSGQTDADLGCSIAVADVDGDGCADILVCAPMWRTGPRVTGREFIFRGARSAPAGKGGGAVRR